MWSEPAAGAVGPGGAASTPASRPEAFSVIAVGFVFGYYSSPRFWLLQLTSFLIATVDFVFGYYSWPRFWFLQLASFLVTTVGFVFGYYS